MKRVLLVDDHVLFRQCLACVLDRSNPGFEVVGQAGSLAEVRASKEAGGIDIALVDLGLPDGDGVELVRELREANPPVPVLVLTTVFDPAWHARAREAGAEGVLTTAASLQEIFEASKRVAAS